MPVGSDEDTLHLTFLVSTHNREDLSEWDER